MNPKADYIKIITTSINCHSAHGLIDQETIYNLFPSRTPATTKKKIKEAMAQNHNLIGRVAGIYPDTNTIIHITETKLGIPIKGSDLMKANLIAKEIIDNLTSSFLKDFSEKCLGSDYNYKTGKIKTSFTTLNNKLLKPYQEYLTKIDNALVSIAGTLNQSLIVHTLRNSGLSDTSKPSNPRSFCETGTGSKGDIQIYHTGPGKSGSVILYIEAKSYAARERLLRGLTDMKTPKVGVGFFNDASEFSAKRVEQFATTAQTQAVYMPRQTYNNLTQEAIAVHYPSTGRICRILEIEFISDMEAFKQKGIIPQR